jgi:hypothetical protein
VPYKKEFDDSFVFLPTVNSWMTKTHQDLAGVDRIFELRLWHMDYNLLDTFEKEIENILKDCIKYTNSHHSNMDVEHAYYKNLHTYKTIELDKIGVCGNIALNGKYIDE